MSQTRHLIPYAGFDPQESDWGQIEPTPLAWWAPKDGPQRRPAHQIRSKTVALSVTPGNRDFILDEARRRGIAPCRMLGDLVELIVEQNLFNELLGSDEAGGS